MVATLVSRGGGWHSPWSRDVNDARPRRGALCHSLGPRSAQTSRRHALDVTCGAPWVYGSMGWHETHPSNTSMDRVHCFLSNPPPLRPAPSPLPMPPTPQASLRGGTVSSQRTSLGPTRYWTSPLPPPAWVSAARDRSELGLRRMVNRFVSSCWANGVSTSCPSILPCRRRTREHTGGRRRRRGGGQPAIRLG